MITYEDIVKHLDMAKKFIIAGEDYKSTFFNF